jgi:phosphoribosylaminoimidazolecarboxamide formyltransferase/IMP cyclohydrolase
VVKALISVYDKTDVVHLATKLVQLGVELLSTGGTHRLLSEEDKLLVRQVSDATGFPEILGGRVKTLHPRIHGGLLAIRDNPSHMTELQGHGIEPIDIVVVNLYPFVETVNKASVTLREALENIDIGGPAMLRAAAKNFPYVLVIVDPDDYGWVLERMHAEGVSQEERRYLASKAFHHVSLYDSAVAQYLSTEDGDELPKELSLAYRKIAQLRYGENPHQKASLYAPLVGSGRGIAGARQLHGKELSFNNLLDAEAAWSTVTDFEEPAAVVIKHTTPCGLACDTNLAKAYLKAHAGDPVSAFGGIVGFNRPVTGAAATEMSSIFYELVVAPDYTPESLDVLRRKRNLRIMAVPDGRVDSRAYDLRPLSGGVLVQTQDILRDDPTTWKIVTQRHPTEAEMVDLAFAWKAAKHVKSNAIVLAKQSMMVGMGAGQPNRVNSVHLALRAAGRKAIGSVLASDAFFPFPDNIDLASNGGVTAIIQPGGSIRDQKVIDAADKCDIAMVYTGVRHFRH